MSQVNELPSLEDVLSENHQNPRYTLKSLRRFCASFPPGSLKPLPIATAGNDDPLHKPDRPRTQAIRVLEFWQAVHGFVLRYERNLTSRTPSLMGTSPSEVQDALYVHAKRIFSTYLLDIVELEKKEAEEKAAALEAAKKKREERESKGEEEGQDDEALPAILTTPVRRGSIALMPTMKTRCGLDLPAHLLQAVRGTLGRTVEVTYVDPLLGTEMSTVQHHTVPITLFDRVQREAFKWLKNKVFTSWLSRIEEQVKAENKALKESTK